ncbi:hypothetical protein G6F24_013947 [Rhizopus arrhizus]|nr:hypothetical protein G6F24_013947 [Rhizopus arrhizus]
MENDRHFSLHCPHHISTSTLDNYFFVMPYKLSNDTRNNVISLIKAGKGTKNIVQATGVSRALAILMKKQVDPDRVKPRGGRVSIVVVFGH